jgi:hypothetical protein
MVSLSRFRLLIVLFFWASLAHTAKLTWTHAPAGHRLLHARQKSKASVGATGSFVPDMESMIRITTNGSSLF